VATALAADGPAFPVRLGLSLLPQTPEARRADAGWDGVDTVSRSGRATIAPMPDARLLLGAERARPIGGEVGALPALLAFAIAVGAGVQGALVVAGVALLVAGWFAVGFVVGRPSTPPRT
jgi:hypothetical protein